MPAAKQGLRIEQGATFRLSLQWKTNNLPVNLAGFQALMQIRSEVSAQSIIHELSTTNGGVIFKNEAEGEIELFISHTDTSLFRFNSAVYDLELHAPNGDVTRLLEGKVTLSMEVTRD